MREEDDPVTYFIQEPSPSSILVGSPFLELRFTKFSGWENDVFVTSMCKGSL